MPDDKSDQGGVGMSQPITMPALSDTMSNGKLVKWTKKTGDNVKKGDVIAEVETDKAVMEVEAFEDGYLSGPLAPEGTEAPVGQTIGYIVENSAEVSGGAKAENAAIPRQARTELGGKTISGKEPAVSAVLAASMASLQPISHRASGAAVALDRLSTNVTRTALEAGPPYRIERTSSLREAVARNMIASATTPSFRITAQIPLQQMIAAAQAKNYSVSLLLARACATAIGAHPLFNAAYTPEGLARRDRVDIGIAVDDGEGLITPVLRDAAARPLAELAEAWAELREKAKNRRLVPAEYNGATFYLSNLGVFPVVYTFDSIIPVGASAILSIASSSREDTCFTLTCDHRVLFGRDAARFLQTLEGILLKPETILSQEAQP